MCKYMWLSCKFFKREKKKDIIQKIVDNMTLREIIEHLDLYSESPDLFSNKELEINIPILRKKHREITGKQYRPKYLSTIQE